MQFQMIHHHQRYEEILLQYGNKGSMITEIMKNYAKEMSVFSNGTYIISKVKVRIFYFVAW